jgi:hypothetical protein
MRTYNAITYLQSIHGHLRELEAILDIKIVCFEVHPEGVYINVHSSRDLDKIGLGKAKPEEVVKNTTMNIDGVEYQFYTFDRKE